MPPNPDDAGGRSAAGSARQPGRFALRIGVIHGNRMMADLLRTYGEKIWGCEVVALEYTGHEGLTSVERAKPDLIVIGHAPPMVDVYTLMDSLKGGSKSVKIIVTTQRVTEYFVHRFASFEFHGVVEESSEGIDAVQNAIERVREGRRLVSPRFSFIAAGLRANPNAFSKVLTKGQERVLLHIAHAMEDEEIGRCLNVSKNTAKRHRTDIMHKLDIHGTPRLIRYCIRAGFSDTCMPPTGPKPAKP